MKFLHLVVALLVGSRLVGQASGGTVVVLDNGLVGDGHLMVAGDEYGFFGPALAGGAATFDPIGEIPDETWGFYGALLVADESGSRRWLASNTEDTFNGGMGGEPLTSVDADEATESRRVSSFVVPGVFNGELEVDLEQQVGSHPVPHFSQTYSFTNRTSSSRTLTVMAFADPDLEWVGNFRNDMVGVIPERQSLFFIEPTDVGELSSVADGERALRVLFRGSTDDPAGSRFHYLAMRAERNGAAGTAGRYLYDTVGIDPSLCLGLTCDSSIADSMRVVKRGIPAVPSVNDDLFPQDGLSDGLGDVAGALQWTTVIPAGESWSVQIEYLTGASVPEPDSLSMMHMVWLSLVVLLSPNRRVARRQ